MKEERRNSTRTLLDLRHLPFLLPPPSFLLLPMAIVSSWVEAPESVLKLDLICHPEFDRSA